MNPLWLFRPLVNWQELADWLYQQGVRKIIPPEQLHSTVATVRTPCRWDDLALETDTIRVPPGEKSVQIFGYTVKALTFGHPRISARHAEMLARYPEMDHPVLRPHITLFRGGRMIAETYRGEIILGPEEARVFDEAAGRSIKHVRLDTIATL